MVGFKVKYNWYQIGAGDFLFSFFSTVAYNLENQKWGSKFSVIWISKLICTTAVENKHQQ